MADMENPLEIPFNCLGSVRVWGKKIRHGQITGIKQLFMPNDPPIIHDLSCFL